MGTKVSSVSSPLSFSPKKIMTGFRITLFMFTLLLLREVSASATEPKCLRCSHDVKHPKRDRTAPVSTTISETGYVQVYTWTWKDKVEWADYVDKKTGNCEVKVYCHTWCPLNRSEYPKDHNNIYSLTPGKEVKVQSLALIFGRLQDIHKYNEDIIHDVVEELGEKVKFYP